MKNYSFKDLSGAFNHPDVGPFAFAGKIGTGQLTVLNSTERTAHAVAADGAVMVSYISGDNGQINIETQQTSDLNNFLRRWFNAIKTAADNGDTSGWAAASLTLRSLVDGTGHVCTGISPAKVPDTPYAAQGQNITWTLMAADIQHLSA